MNSLGDLFDAFYDRFLLRDLFGKAVPGSVVLLTLATEGRWEELGNTLWQLSELDLATQLLLLGVAWIVGLAVQELSHRLARSFPPLSWIGSRLWPERYDCNKKRYALREGLKENDSDPSDAERLAVLKESTGTTSLAVLISLAMVFVSQGKPASKVESATVVALAVAALMLRYATEQYRKRQFDYWEFLANGEPDCTTGHD